MKKKHLISLLAALSLMLVVILAPAMSASAEEPRFDAATGTTYLDPMEDPSIYNEPDRKPSASYDITKDGTSITTSGQHAWIKRDYSPNINVNATYETGVIKFWLYIENPGALTNAWFHIMSNDTQTADGGSKCLMKFEFEKFQALNLQSGWNEVTLSLNAPTEHRNTMDLSKVSYTHFEYESSEPVTIYMDDLRIVDPSKATGGTTSQPPATETSTPATETSTPAAETSTPAAETSTPAGNTSTSDVVEAGNNDMMIAIIIIVVGVLVIAGAAVAVYFLVLRKKPEAKG